jgi:hypothetical protein
VGTGHPLQLKWSGLLNMRAWIGCFIAVIVVALLLNDRPITIAASDESRPSATPSHVVQFAGEPWAR